MIGAGQTGIILLNIQYRLSRIHNAGVQVQTYNRVICFTPSFEPGTNPYFVEGFDAAEVMIESYRTVWSFRKGSLSPVMDYDFDKLRVIGNEIDDPQLRERLSLTPAAWNLKVNDELAWDDLFNATVRYCDASSGEELSFHNSTDGTNNTDVNFYDRDVRSVGRQRNVLGERAMLSPTPVPEPFTEPLMETL